MATRLTLQRLRGLIPFLALLLIPSWALATNGVHDKLLRDAAELTAKGEWRAAGEIYWRVLATDRQAPADVRAKYLTCLRHVRQGDRHADAVYRKRIQDLTLSRSLTAYVEAVGKLQVNYVDREKIALRSLFRHGMEEFSHALASPAFRHWQMPDSPTGAAEAFSAKLKDQWSNEPCRSPAEMRQAIKDIALEAQKALGIKPSVTVMEFVCGACNALDERTGYIPPSEEYTAHLTQLQSLGLIVAANSENVLFVERVAPGTWAAHMGFKAGDRISRLARKDEKDEVGAATEIDVVSRGEITARNIKLPDAASTPTVTDVEIQPDGVGYVKLASFQKTTLQDLEESLMLLRMRGMKALILDLRGNPGGSFPAAVQVAERFLPDGIVVTTQGQSGPFNRTYESTSGMTAIEVPLVVMVDQETASAAEVLAGALKENHRAVLVGQPTYGKGTIQTVLNLTDAGGIRITLARFFTPRGYPYNGVGVTPHIIESMRTREVAGEQARALLSMRP